MTQAEFNSLYDDLYYGHEAEIEWNGRRYYLEQEHGAIAVWSMDGTNGERLKSICAPDRGELVNKLFSEKLFDNRSLFELQTDIAILDID